MKIPNKTKTDKSEVKIENLFSEFPINLFFSNLHKIK